MERHKCEQQVNLFLAAADLRHRAYRIGEFVTGLRRAGFDLVCEPFRPEGTIRAGIFRVGGTTVLFYPDPCDVGFFAALQALAHEAAHLWLQHGLHADTTQEEEAELFARLVIQQRAAAAEAGAETPRALTQYFSTMDQAGV